MLLIGEAPRGRRPTGQSSGRYDKHRGGGGPHRGGAGPAGAEDRGARGPSPVGHLHARRYPPEADGCLSHQQVGLETTGFFGGGRPAHVPVVLCSRELSGAVAASTHRTTQGCRRRNFRQPARGQLQHAETQAGPRSKASLPPFSALECHAAPPRARSNEAQPPRDPLHLQPPPQFPAPSRNGGASRQGARFVLWWIHVPVSYTHLRAHETDSYLVCRLLLEK